MFSPRQLGEKRSEKQEHMALADLERAFDTVPRKMAMATLRWMGAPEPGVKWLKPCMRTPKQEQ